MSNIFCKKQEYFIYADMRIIKCITMVVSLKFIVIQ